MIFLLFFCSMAMNAKTVEKMDLAHYDSTFMTTSDRLSGSLSLLSVKNNSNTVSYQITSLYVSSLGSDPNDCTAGAIIDSFGNPFGALWTPQVSIAPQEVKSIGANYLYNMLMRYLYNASAEGVIALTTPGSSQWCMYLGVTNQTMGTDNLICTQCNLNPENILVPFENVVENRNITCDDATRTCVAATASQQTIG